MKDNQELINSGINPNGSDDMIEEDNGSILTSIILDSYSREIIENTHGKYSSLNSVINEALKYFVFTEAYKMHCKKFNLNFDVEEKIVQQKTVQEKTVETKSSNSCYNETNIKKEEDTIVESKVSEIKQPTTRKRRGKL